MCEMPQCRSAPPNRGRLVFCVRFLKLSAISTLYNMNVFVYISYPIRRVCTALCQHPGRERLAPQQGLQDLSDKHELTPAYTN